MGFRKAASTLMWAACRLLPVQRNKVVFSSYGGKGFGGNPKAVALALLDTGAPLDLVWLTRDTNIALPEGIRPCPFGTPQAVHTLSTAAVWVDDSRSGARFKRSTQFYLQTWHGFALKHIERAAEDSLPASYVAQCRRDSSFIDCIPSNSAFMTRVYREDFWYNGEIAEIGSPRNDVFFRDTSALAAQVRSFFSLPAEQHLLLYAPTFRADGSTDAYRMDMQAVLSACAQRFGGQWSALIRLHPNIAALSDGLFPYDGQTILDATAYPDMQELLAAVDLLLTDYSSSMFDYALQGKPCIQYAADIEAYQKDRSFYFPLDALPFPLATTPDALCQCIVSFDSQKQQETWARFAEAQGFCEDGHAAARCAELILSHMKRGSL